MADSVAGHDGPQAPASMLSSQLSDTSGRPKRLHSRTSTSTNTTCCSRSSSSDWDSDQEGSASDNSNSFVDEGGSASEAESEDEVAAATSANRDPLIMFRVHLALELGGGYCTIRMPSSAPVCELRDALLHKLSVKNKYVGSVGKKGLLERLRFFLHDLTAHPLVLEASEELPLTEAFPALAGAVEPSSSTGVRAIALTMGYALPQQECGFSYDAFTSRPPESPCVYVHIHECSGLHSRDRNGLADPLVLLEIAPPVEPTDNNTTSALRGAPPGTISPAVNSASFEHGGGSGVRQFLSTQMYQTLSPRLEEETVLTLLEPSPTLSPPGSSLVSDTSPLSPANASADDSNGPTPYQVNISPSPPPLQRRPRVPKRPLQVWVWNRGATGSTGDFLGFLSIPWWEYMANELVSRRFTLQPGPGKFAKCPVGGSILLSFHYTLASHSYGSGGGGGGGGSADGNDSGGEEPLEAYYGKHARKNVQRYRSALTSLLLMQPSASSPSGAAATMLRLMYLFVRWEHSSDLVRAVLRSCDPNTSQGRQALDSIFVIFRHHTFRATVAMICDTVTHEIATTKFLAELFRANCAATVLLSRFVRETAGEFCVRLLGPVLSGQVLKKRSRMLSLGGLWPSEVGGSGATGDVGQGSSSGAAGGGSGCSPCEIDPLRVQVGADLHKNAQRLRTNCDLVLQVILNSLPGMGEEGGFLDDRAGGDSGVGLLTGLVGGMKRKKKRITIPPTLSYMAFHLEGAVRRGIRLRRRYLEQRAIFARSDSGEEAWSGGSLCRQRRSHGSSQKRHRKTREDDSDSSVTTSTTTTAATSAPELPPKPSRKPEPKAIPAAEFVDPDPKFNLPNVLQLTLVNCLFLRFVCPAIVSPQSYDIIPANTSLPIESRRTLVLMAKVIQTAANSQRMDDVFRKEQYMTAMNDYIAQMSPKITAYLFGLAAGYKRQASEQHRQELNASLQQPQVQSFPGPALPSFEPRDADLDTHQLAMARLVQYIHEHREDISRQIDLLQTVITTDQAQPVSTATAAAAAAMNVSDWPKIGTSADVVGAMQQEGGEEAKEPPQPLQPEQEQDERGHRLLAGAAAESWNEDELTGVTPSDMIELTELEAEIAEAVLDDQARQPLVDSIPSDYPDSCLSEQFSLGPEDELTTAPTPPEETSALAGAVGLSEQPPPVTMESAVRAPVGSESQQSATASSANRTPQLLQRRDSVGENPEPEEVIDPRQLLQLYLALVEQATASLPK